MHPSWHEHWLALNHWLSRHRLFWEASPFTREPAWLDEYPDLLPRLERISDVRVDAFQDRPAGLAALLADRLPGLSERESLIRLSRLQGPDSVLPEARAMDMPERKRRQAGAFTGAIRPLSQPLLDWCCGKGHLARTLAAHGDMDVLGWERQPALVADGNRLARRAALPVTIQERDVLETTLGTEAGRHAVALHACGDLHRRLLRDGSAVRLPRLSLSPCCYHLTVDEEYRPLSARVCEHRGALMLTREQLRLAVQESVTAPARVRREQQRVRAWRLGFDGLQRELRGEDRYLPVPPHPPALLHGDFEGFCRWAASCKGLELPTSVDFGHWERHGEQRLVRVRRLELLRHLFRRPLELWLALDLVLFLEESDYRVRLGTFCERALTPRNLLIDARR